VVPPASDCPTCGADLPKDAQECRRCGERLRLCNLCGAVNTWRTHVCRADASHVIRPQLDWLVSPGGAGTHAQPPQQAAGTCLARVWSLPSFPTASDSAALEWSAPVMAFGIIVASAIDSARERSIVYAHDVPGGTWLWEYDLGDPSGIYPDRGGLAIAAADGLLYAATLNGTVVALDSIRGTLRWSAKVEGPVYGGPALSPRVVVIPAGRTLHVFDRLSGAAGGQIACEGRLDTAPAVTGDTLVAADDSGAVSAFRLPDGALLWRHKAGGSYDAAPLIAGDTVYAASTAGVIVALNLADGAVRWTTQASTKPIGATPALSLDGLIYAGADDGCLHVIAAATGHQIRTRRISESPIRTAPVCAASAVFVGAYDGSIYAMTPDYTSQRAYETTQGARIGGAGMALYGDYLAAVATNGLLYVLRLTTL
jgi:outer membrane protein assembly factor BamB